MTVFGGEGNEPVKKNDVHTLDLVTGNWSEVTTSAGMPPSARAHHSAVHWVDSATNVTVPKMTVFGGLEQGNTFPTDVNTLNLATGAWSEAITSGTLPGGRMWHSAVIRIDNVPKMTVFGGVGGLSGVHTLNLATSAWSGAMATPGTPPSARSDHSAVGWIDPTTHSPKMTVFGGMESVASYKNDVHTLDLATGAWGGAVSTSGTPPSARDQHSAVSWIDPTTHLTKMTVFGGSNKASNLKNDVHILDLATGNWSGTVSTSGAPPSARAGHSAVSWIDATTHSPKMTVFGGKDGISTTHSKNDVPVAATRR
jgi:hypothetical protein